MKQVGDGPELMTDLAAEFAESRHFAFKKIDKPQAHFLFANEYERDIILSEVSGRYTLQFSRVYN